MMLGNNTLILNTATMIEAVQEYLDQRTQNVNFKVTMVKPDRDHTTDGTFMVTIEEQKK